MSTANTILGYTLQPISLALLSALERLGLPFVEMVEIIFENKDKPPSEIAALIESKFHITVDQEMAIVWCFTTPISDLETEIVKGKDQVMQHVRQTFGTKHHPKDLGKFNSTIMVYYVESFRGGMETLATAEICVGV